MLNRLRALSRQPSFTLIVLITLGVGIGASTAIFSVAEAVLFRPLPYRDPDHLVYLWNRLEKTGVEKSAIAPPDFVDYIEQARRFEDFTALSIVSRSISDDESRPEPIYLAWASPNFFSLLGTELFLGEMYSLADEGRSQPQDLLDPEAELPPSPLILSYELWQRRYGGDPGVLGRTVRVNGQAMVIQGVAPKGFRLFLPADAPLAKRIDVWAPSPFPWSSGSRTTQFLAVFARLKPGVALSDAQQEMDAIAARQRQLFEFHKNVGMQIRVVPMHQDVTGHVRSYLVWFLLAAGLLLVLTFSNVTNLMLLRSSQRRRELSVRAALGSRPGQLATLVLTESVLLALAGTALGLLLGRGGIRLLLTLQPEGLPRVEEANLDGPVLLAALGIALVAAVICGLVPAIQSSRLNLATDLSQRSVVGSRRSQWLRRGLVVVEIAISLCLLISTGLVLRSFTALTRVDPGFRAEGVLTAKVGVPSFKYSLARERADFYQELGRRVASLPGVESVGGAHPLPLTEGVSLWWGPWATEQMDLDEWSKNEADFRQVLPGYFETMGIPLLSGRTLEPRDDELEAPYVVVIDERMARRAFPGEDPLGKRLLIWQFGEGENEDLRPTWTEVVGVVAHVRDRDLTRDGGGTVYCPQRFYGFPELSLTLRSTTSDPFSLVEPLRQVVAEMDPDLPLTGVRLMQSYVDEALAPTRFALALLGVFAGIAAILAAVGLYGVISSSVQQRTREIGIRMAFGAQHGTILSMVFREALTLILSGTALGLLAAFLVTRGLSGVLFGVTATDPTTFTVIALAQVAIAIVACLVPPWRATRVDPVTVLRAE